MPSINDCSGEGADIISSAQIPVSSADFRHQISDATEAEWATHQKQASDSARNGTQPAVGDAERVFAVWFEPTDLGWLSWGVSGVTESQHSLPELTAIGLIDHSWATTLLRRKSALAHAEHGRRRSKFKWWNARLASAVGIAFAFLVAGASVWPSHGWPVSVAIVLGIAVYNFTGLSGRFSRRHVRVFGGTALAATRNELFALLSPVSAIARTSRAMNAVTGSPADQELVDGALSEALKAVWQATDPESTRAEVDEVKTGWSCWRTPPPAFCAPPPMSIRRRTCQSATG